MIPRIIFARTRHQYDSYSDFWRLVNLSDFEACWVDEIDLEQDVTYITTPINGELRPHVNHRRTLLQQDQRAKIIWWDLERPDATGAPPIKEVLDEIQPYIDGAWVSDRLVASLDSRFKHVVLGGHAGLRQSPSLECVYHYTHQSYSWGRREHIYKSLQARGLREGPSCYGSEREQVLASSRLVLNIQQYTLPVVAPLRFVLAAAYHIPVLTERVHDTCPYGDAIIQTNYDDLVDGTIRTLARTDLGELGLRLHRTLCEEWTFRRGVEEALK
jgi:hypothetical protein